VPIDKDNDGIPNAVDKCPDQPEDKNGYEDQDGCPDEDQRVAAVEADQQRAMQEKLRAAQEAEAAAERKRQEEAAAAKAKADEEERARQAADAKRKEDEARAQQHQAAVDAAQRQRTLGIVLTSVGGGLIVAGGVFAIVGNDQYSQIKSGGFATASDISSADSTGQVLSGVGIATAIIGAGVAGWGLVDFLTAHPPADEKGSPGSTGSRGGATVSLIPGGASLRVRFQ
jgi:hypothetical protein